MAAVSNKVVYRNVDKADARALALVYAKAEAHRTGRPIPAEVDEPAIDGVRARLADPAARAVLGFDGNQPVVGCFATQAVVDGKPIRRRAHVSGLSVDPGRWGQGLATEALQRLEEILVSAGYDTAQLQVLETNARARSLYEYLGWRLVRLGEPHPAGPHAIYDRRLEKPG